MTVRIQASALPFRWFAPTGVGALVAAAMMKLRQRVAQPGMPRMSSEWLLSHDQLVGRRSKY